MATHSDCQDKLYLIQPRPPNNAKSQTRKWPHIEFRYPKSVDFSLGKCHWIWRRTSLWCHILAICSLSWKRQGNFIKKRNKVEVYSLVSSAKSHPPDFTRLPLVTGPVHSLAVSTPPGNIQLGCHFRRTDPFKHTSLHCRTRYPLTPGSRECTCGQSASPKSKTLENNSTQPGIEPAISRL